MRNVTWSMGIFGEVAERSKAAVLKTVGPVRGPGVRIPPSPQILKQLILITYTWGLQTKTPCMRIGVVLICFKLTVAM